MNIAEKRVLVEAFIRAYNSFDLDGMAALLHPQIIFKNVSGGKTDAEAQGLDEFRAIAEQSASLFSIRTQTIKGFYEDGDKALAEITFTAVAAFDFPGGPAKGQNISITGRSEYIFKDGLIAGITDIS